MALVFQTRRGERDMLQRAERGLAVLEAQLGALCACKGDVSAHIPHTFLLGSIASNAVMSPDLWFPGREGGREVPSLLSSKSWDAAEYSGVPSAGTVSSCCAHGE